MSDPENPAQPLLRAPSAAAPEGGRPSRAYKVAGLTLLACILIVGQVMTAYFLLSQKSDIKSLEEQNNNMQAELTKGRSVSVPVRMHMPMNALTKLTYDPEDEESSTGKLVPLQGTPCQQEAAGVKPVQVPGFLPVCDESGLYKAQQCFMNHCWCVNPSSGEQVPGSLSSGPVRCGGARPAARMNTMLGLDDIAQA